MSSVTGPFLCLGFGDDYRVDVTEVASLALLLGAVGLRSFDFTGEKTCPQDPLVLPSLFSRSDSCSFGDIR